MSSAPGIETRDLNLWYGDFAALKNVTLGIQSDIITSLIGPSGCGKSTLLRCFNRMNERYGNVRTSGSIRIHGHDIYHPDVSLSELRKSVGMVFQRPNPLPFSVYENIVFGQRVHAEARLSRSQTDRLVEDALRQVDLWDSLRDQLGKRATHLALEQQQRLCIARLLPLKPRVILMDEPCSALDVEGTRAVEDLIRGLAGHYTVIIVTHNMAQARRISTEAIFMLLGEVVEHGPTEQLFQHPLQERTRLYVAGEYA